MDMARLAAEIHLRSQRYAKRPDAQVRVRQHPRIRLGRLPAHLGRPRRARRQPQLSRRSASPPPRRGGRDQRRHPPRRHRWSAPTSCSPAASRCSTRPRCASPGLPSPIRRCRRPPRTRTSSTWSAPGASCPAARWSIADRRMSQFEYLSVLISIIVGLAITQLLSGAARLIQLRRRDRGRTRRRSAGWRCCSSINTQIWWAAFERRDSAGLEFLPVPALPADADHRLPAQLPAAAAGLRTATRSTWRRISPATGRWFFGAAGAAAVREPGRGSASAMGAPDRDARCRVPDRVRAAGAGRQPGAQRALPFLECAAGHWRLSALTSRCCSCGCADAQRESRSACCCCSVSATLLRR